MNTERLTKDYDAPVITFSHFVPRPELMRASVQDETEIALERNIMVSVLYIELTLNSSNPYMTYSSWLLRLLQKIVVLTLILNLSSVL